MACLPAVTTCDLRQPAEVFSAPADCAAKRTWRPGRRVRNGTQLSAYFSTGAPSGSNCDIVRCPRHGSFTPESGVGQYMQRHLGGNLWQRLHQEMGCTHPGLDRAEGMLDRRENSRELGSTAHHATRSFARHSRRDDGVRDSLMANRARWPEALQPILRRISRTSAALATVKLRHRVDITLSILSPPVRL